MTFKVDSFQLGMYAGIVRNHHEDAVAAKEFAEKNLHIGSQPGVLVSLVGSHEEARRDVISALTALVEVCGAAATELDRTWRMYDSVDRAEAERLDGTYPQSEGRPEVPPLPGQSGESMPMAITQHYIPAGRLSEPKPLHGFTNPMQPINDIGNLISVGFWAQKFLEATIRVNPVQEASQWVAGDWEQFAKAASTLHSLSWFCTDVAEDQRVNINALLDHWTGNAANSAFQYFNNLGHRVGDYSAALATLREKYMEAARGAWEAAEALSDIIQGIFDNIFWASAAAIAGGVLAETVVGPAILWSFAALECKNMVELWQDATRLIMAIQNTIRGIHGSVLELVGTNGAFQTHPLPAGYDHPGA